MPDQENKNTSPFHKEGSAIIFEKPQSQEEISRQRREDEQHEFSRKQVTSSERVARFTKWLMVSSAISICIGILQGYVSLRAANAARNAANTADATLKDNQKNKQSSDAQFSEQLAKIDSSIRQAERLANATTQEAETTRRLTIVAQKSLVATIQQFEQSQRPWILIDRAELVRDLSSETPTPIIFGVKNVGASPALGVTSQTRLSLEGGTCKGIAVSSPYTSQSNIGPNQIEAYPSLGLSRIDPQCIADLDNGIATFILHGTLTYHDIFGKDHRTSYCYRYEGLTTHTMSGCPSGNVIQ